MKLKYAVVVMTLRAAVGTLSLFCFIYYKSIAKEYVHLIIFISITFHVPNQATACEVKKRMVVP